MKKVFQLFLVFSIPFLLTFCGPAETESEQETENTTDTETTSEETETEPVEKKYTLTEISSPEFEGASLKLNNLENGLNIPAATFQFDFSVENYELGAQTSDAEGKGLANSGKGQHIHLILNNDPYSAHYEPKAEKELAEGSYVALAFLSRSYHESVKSSDAFVVRAFSVGEADDPEFDPEGEHMFYSRPKGEYTMNEGDQLLLDFYLLNTELAADGNKVKATINGEEHIIEKWAPYGIAGLEMGEVTVKLELIDAEGNAVEGPFNVVERTVVLKPAEAE